MSRYEAREVAFHLLYMMDLHQNFSQDFCQQALEGCRQNWGSEKKPRQGWLLSTLRREQPQIYSKFITGGLSKELPEKVFDWSLTAVEGSGEGPQDPGPQATATARDLSAEEEEAGLREALDLGQLEEGLSAESFIHYLYSFGLDERSRDYCQSLVDGVLAHCAELDAALQPYLKVWEVSRLPVVDRALLRLGAYEISYDPSVPKSVTINEIVNLTRIYTTESSRRYINAVLAHFNGPEPAARDEAREDAQEQQEES